MNSLTQIDQLLQRRGYHLAPRHPISRRAILAARQRRQQQREAGSMQASLTAAAADLHHSARCNADLLHMTADLTRRLNTMAAQVHTMAAQLRGLQPYTPPQLSQSEALPPCSGGGAQPGAYTDGYTGQPDVYGLHAHE